jgi:predicted nuclease of predicted toxin-antitoxin system
VALKFYLDTHIAKAAAVQLRSKNVDVMRCEEVNMAEASDEEHLVYATNHGRIMVSQDDDFNILNVQWQEVGRSHAGIMKVPHVFKGEAQISHTVQQVLFYVEAEQSGAVNYVTEIANHVIYL